MQVNIQIAKEDYKPEMATAIGHLISWGISNFPILEVFVDVCDNEERLSLLGIFKNKDGSHGYTIGAWWSGKGYSYHS